MKTLLVVSVLLLASMASAEERVQDGGGSRRGRGGHFGDFGDSDEAHDDQFDHEAVLGSAREAEEFDRLPAAEAKERLLVLAGRMDQDSDGHVSPAELKRWILRSFRSLSEEESREKLLESDQDGDGAVTWAEYLAETYGVDDEDEAPPADADEARLMTNDRELFQAADADADGRLDANEFVSFTHPEEAPHMLDVILRQTRLEKDLNGDGFIDFGEYIGPRGDNPNGAVDLERQREMFDAGHDLDGDGLLDADEFKRWVAPSNEEIADEEVDHLFAAADDDHDALLSLQEIVDHHDVFVGSEATDYGDHLTNIHRFQDEL